MVYLQGGIKLDFIEVTGKTIEEAVLKGCAELGKTQDEVEITVLEQPSSGFLGFGRKDARVKVVVKQVETIVEKTVEPEPTYSEEQDIAVSEVPSSAEEKTAEPTVSVEDKAVVAEAARKFLYDLFEKMNLEVMIEKMISNDKITFQVHGDNLGILIGKHGQTLDSIQYLTNLIANKQVENRMHIVVDVENYRSRREATLVQLAKRLSEKVKRDRKRVVLEPMNAYDRKIIHLALQNVDNIRTDSEGEGTYRHVVISYIK